jgi:hypothetical protein
MSRLQIGIISYASVAASIARELGVEPAPDCRIGQGRIYLTFCGLGASRWDVDRQADYAARAAETARAVLANDRRVAGRRRVRRAIVVAYEDRSLVRGCATTARWECVIPG